MAEIRIPCPVSGEPIPTGIDVSRRVFEASQFQGNQVWCPRCRQMHPWDKENARLADDERR